MEFYSQDSCMSPVAATKSEVSAATMNRLAQRRSTDTRPLSAAQNTERAGAVWQQPFRSDEGIGWFPNNTTNDEENSQREKKSFSELLNEYGKEDRVYGFNEDGSSLPQFSNGANWGSVNASVERPGELPVTTHGSQNPADSQSALKSPCRQSHGVNSSPNEDILQRKKRQSAESSRKYRMNMKNRALEQAEDLKRTKDAVHKLYLRNCFLEDKCETWEYKYNELWKEHVAMERLVRDTLKEKAELEQLVTELENCMYCRTLNGHNIGPAVQSDYFQQSPQFPPDFTQ